MPSEVLRRLVVPLLLTGAAAAAAGRYAFVHLLQKPARGFPELVRLDVRPGDSFGQVAARLEAVGAIPSARALTLWARWKGFDRSIRAGAYEFRNPLAPLEILEKMRNGEALLLRVTIPEGATASEVASLLERAGVGTKAEYDALFAEPDFPRSIGIPADSVEGYLFPDTYFFSPLTSPRAVLARLARRFREVFEPQMERRAAELGMSVHQVVTLASIVEKETALPSERPLVASVFLNRLRRGMPLQADPTVIYGISGFGGNLTRRDLQTPTAYNTYTFPGLPPGPIANPGREALLAVLHPADTDFLYFVSRNDGSHEFSATLAEHNRAVRKYQKAEPPGSRG
jgi:UPF0755 protein